MSYSNEPPAPPPPPGYGQPQYGGAPQTPKTSVMAIISLVLGILGLCCTGWFVLSIAAAVLGFLGKKEVDESHGAKKGRGMALAGLILGVIGIALGVLWWVLIAADVIDMNYYSDIS